MDLLTISVLARESKERPYTLVALAGEVDMTNRQQMQEVLESELSANPRMLIVDMSGLTFIDSSALKVLLKCTRQMSEAGGVLRVVRPQGAVARIFHFTRADQLLAVYDSLDLAAAAG